MLDQSKGKIINISIYLEKKNKLEGRSNIYKKTRYKKLAYDFSEDEERRNTLQLCMRVIARMEEEQY